MSETIDHTSDEAAVAIDWETFYDSRAGYSLAKMPTWQYCTDARFDPYLVAICGRDIFDEEMAVAHRMDKTVFRNLDDGRQLYIGRPEKYPGWEKLKGRLLIAHNASFDEVVLLELVKRGVLPRFLKDNRWACTADLSAYLMAPRNLKGAMKELFGREISKEVRAGMDGRHDYELNEQEYHDLVEYGGSDAVECHDIWSRYSVEFPYMERRISELNRESTIRGVRLDAESVHKAIKELESYLAVVACDIPWYPEKALGSLPALKKAVIDMGLTPCKSFKKDDPGFLRWQEQHGNIPFIKARQKAISISMCLARLRTMESTMDSEDRSHPVFMYYGAHTGRFSGKSESAAKMNLLNLPRKPVLSGDEHVFGGAGVDIRGMYIADLGRSFYVADYEQIESRMSLWLANDTHMMDALKREGNLYAANAVAMGWCKSGEDIKHDKPDLYRLAKCCLTGDTLVLVRSEKQNGGFTKPYYKRIVTTTTADQVWDGHEWTTHQGVERIKYVSRDELIETGGICLTRDHKVYINDTTSRRADEVFGNEETAAVAWGQANNPVRGWAHVWILATALVNLGARALYLGAREALHLLAGALSMHRVRRGSPADVGQCSEGSDDQVSKMRACGVTEKGSAKGMGEDA